MTIPLKLNTLLLFGAVIVLVVIIISFVNNYYVASATNNNIGRLPNPSALSKVIIPYKYVPHVMIFDIALFVVTLILRKGKIM